MPRTEDLRLRLGRGLAGLLNPAHGPSLYPRLVGLSAHFAQEMGVVLPETRLEVDSDLDDGEYVIELRSGACAHGCLEPNRLLAVGDDEAMGPLLGMTTQEPVYGMPGKWILPAQLEQAALQGCLVFDPLGLIATHLTELLTRELHTLLDLDQVAARLEKLRAERPALVEAALQRLPLTGCHGLMRRLLKERVSVADTRAVLEAVVARVEPEESLDLETVTGLVRSELARVVCGPLVDEAGVLHAVTLSEGAEAVLKKDTRREGGLAPDLGERLLGALARELTGVMEQGCSPVLLVDFELRPTLRDLMVRMFPDTPVLSWTEIPETVQVRVAAVVGSRFHPEARSLPRKTWQVGATSVSAIPGV